MTAHFMDQIREARLAPMRPPEKPGDGLWQEIAAYAAAKDETDGLRRALVRVFRERASDHTRQRKLLDGADCLAGQLDLFDAPADDEPPDRLTATEIGGVIEEARKHRGTCPECGEKDRPLCEDVTGTIGRRLCIACWSWATDSELRRLEPSE
ncbi:MAG: hypothetical protein ABSG86_07775 [Thermoguttaceae bacterium]|jgi:hypothetical protein